MSGVQVDAEINGLFNDTKMRGTHKFAFFNIEGKKKIVTDVCGDPCKTETKEEDEVHLNRMKEQLTNEPWYILYDFGFMKKDGRRVNKLAFIFWWVRLFCVFLTRDRRGIKTVALVSRHFRLEFFFFRVVRAFYVFLVKVKNLNHKRRYKCNRIWSLRDRRFKGKGKEIPGLREARNWRAWGSVLNACKDAIMVFHVYRRDVRILITLINDTLIRLIEVNIRLFKYVCEC